MVVITVSDDVLLNEGEYIHVCTNAQHSSYDAG